MSGTPDQRNQNTQVPTIRTRTVFQRQGKPVAGVAGRGSTAYLVIDCSDSMAGNKLTQAKQGAIDFARNAQRKGYMVGIIEFSTSATNICEPQREVEALQHSMGSISVGGTTNMAAGIKLATEKLRGRTGLRAMVIVTDGMPDSAEDAIRAADHAKGDGGMVRAAQQIPGSGLEIITIGTDDADQEFLARIASKTELVVMVSSHQLGQGIASAARMLPSGND